MRRIRSQFLFTYFMLSSTAWAIPKYGSTILPIDPRMYENPENVEMLSYLPNLTVQGDTDDPHHFYYHPIFKAVVHQHAASLIVNRSQIRRADEAEVHLQDSDPTQLISILAQAGAHSDSEKLTEYDSRMRAVSRLNRSIGGVLTVNLYAGLHPEELALVKQYHLARQKLGLPPVRISRLPVESLEWHSLTETVLNNRGRYVSEGTPIYRAIKGGGSYEGATLNLDLTLDGARLFSLAPPPVILPIYAKTKLLQQYPSFRAYLSCDFQSRWKIEGSTDLKNGLVIFHNDMIRKWISVDDSGTSEPCHLWVETTAGKEAALQRAIEAVQSKLSEAFLERSHLSQKEKTRYMMALVKDPKKQTSNPESSGWTTFLEPLLEGKMGVAIVSIWKQISQFYWHTEVENIEAISKLRWEENLSEYENKPVEVDLGTQVCLAFNPAAQMYVSCSEREAGSGMTIREAAYRARKSKECSGISGSVECGNIRSEKSARDPLTGNITAPEEI